MKNLGKYLLVAAAIVTFVLLGSLAMEFAYRHAVVEAAKPANLNQIKRLTN